MQNGFRNLFILNLFELFAYKNLSITPKGLEIKKKKKFFREVFIEKKV